MEAKKPLTKAEAIKQGKANTKLDSTSNANQHVVVGEKGRSISYPQSDLPELPVVHFKACDGCTLEIPQGTKVVKVMMEGCKDCTLNLAKCAISTSILEVWRCEGCAVNIDCDVGTFQVDLCTDTTVTYAAKAQLGSLVQAGMKDLAVKFSDDPSKDFVTGLEQLRAQHPDVNINDDTDQFITRVVDGNILTEQIVRLANDFPTTAREKEKFDEEARRKADALEGIAESMLGGTDLAEVKDQAAKQREQADKDADISPEARATFKKNMGNECFKKGEFTQAAVFYTEAILINDKDVTIFSNRAQCFLKIGQPAKALEDADACIKLDETFVKGHFRRGVALIALERFEEGAAAMSKVLDMDPKNKDAQMSLQVAQIKAQKARQQLA